MDTFDILLQGYKGDSSLIKNVIIKEISRVSPKKKTLDMLDTLLQDISCKKVIIRKLSDYKEGDIF